jgi:hypothetical protein
MGGGQARPVGLALRLRARRRRHALTAALAAGADPGGSEELALVAGQLTRPRTRRHLAEGIERVLRAATGPLRRRPPARHWRSAVGAPHGAAATRRPVPAVGVSDR